MPPLEGATVLTSGMSGLVPVAHSANYNNMAFMTPPLVSSGAVAYGVTSGPTYGATTFAAGGPAGGLTIRAPEPRVVTYTFRNVEVLSALQKLTGRDFGYDIPSWKRWIAHDFNPRPSRPGALLEP